MKTVMSTTNAGGLGARVSSLGGHSTRRRLAASTLALLPALAGCNQILGLEDPILVAGTAGLSAGGSSGAGTAGRQDAVAGAAGQPSTGALGGGQAGEGGTAGHPAWGGTAGAGATAGDAAAGTTSSGGAGGVVASGGAAGSGATSGTGGVSTSTGGSTTAGGGGALPSTGGSGGQSGYEDTPGGWGGAGSSGTAGQGATVGGNLGSGGSTVGSGGSAGQGGLGGNASGGGSAVCAASQYSCEPSGNMLQRCSADGTAIALSVPCGAGICDAVGGECDVCAAGQPLGCIDSAHREVCDTNGQDSHAVVCAEENPDTPICVGAGLCRACDPGTTECVGAAEIRTCGVDGQWEAPEGCDVSTTCVDQSATSASCQGSCGPTQRTCIDGVPYACDALGEFAPATECATDQICSEGSCVECITGTKDCVRGVPRECVSEEWQVLPACTGNTVCALSDCIDIEMARWPMPNEPSSAIRPARYEFIDSGELVRDLVTGLEWQAGVSSSAIPFSSVTTYCQDLYLAGHQDYHLPSAIELYSLVDYSVTPGLMLNSAFFPDTPTVSLARSGLAVHFDTGDIQEEDGIGMDYILRCVRSTQGETATERYTVDADSVVDNFTGLDWASAQVSMVYGDSFRSSGCPYPQRVPTFKELMTLIDRSVAAAPLVDTDVFSNMAADWYWSITGAGPGYVLDFSDASLRRISLSTDAHGRCLME